MSKRINTIASLVAQNPLASLTVVGSETSVAVCLTNDASNPAGMLLTHKQWSDLLIDILTNGPVDVLHTVRSALYPDDGK